MLNKLTFLKETSDFLRKPRVLQEMIGLHRESVLKESIGALNDTSDSPKLSHRSSSGKPRVCKEVTRSRGRRADVEAC